MLYIYNQYVTSVRLELAKSPEVSLSGGRGYTPSMNKITITHYRRGDIESHWEIESYWAG